MRAIPCLRHLPALPCLVNICVALATIREEENVHALLRQLLAVHEGDMMLQLDSCDELEPSVDADDTLPASAPAYSSHPLAGSYFAFLCKPFSTRLCARACTHAYTMVQCVRIHVLRRLLILPN